MTKNEKQRLCGGTFFTLLLQARKPRKGVREHYMGTTDGLSEPDTLIALAKVVVPDFSKPLEFMETTIKGNAFDYKTCKNAGGTYFPFADSVALKVFDDCVKTDYRSALAAMFAFVDLFIDVGGSTKKDERLVRALVELVCLDDTIENEQCFYINEGGTPSTKSDLYTLSDICLQPFLLGVFNFAVHRTEGNTIGKETYEAWCPSQGGAPRTYTATLGEFIGRSIHLSYCEEEVPTVEAEIMDDKNTETGEQSTPEGASSGVTQQVINHNPTFFNFNVTGSNNSFYNQVDTVIIKNGGRKDE